MGLDGGWDGRWQRGGRLLEGGDAMGDTGIRI